MKASFLKIILTACLFSAITLLNTSCSNFSTSSKTRVDSTDNNPPSTMSPIDTLKPHDSTDNNPPVVKMKTTTKKLHDSTDNNPPK